MICHDPFIGMTVYASLKQRKADKHYTGLGGCSSRPRPEQSRRGQQVRNSRLQRFELHSVSLPLFSLYWGLTIVKYPSQITAGSGRILKHPIMECLWIEEGFWPKKRKAAIERGNEEVIDDWWDFSMFERTTVHLSSQRDRGHCSSSEGGTREWKAEGVELLSFGCHAWMPKFTCTNKDSAITLFYHLQILEDLKAMTSLNWK